MKILITGNKGLIGQYIETELMNNGHEVVGFDLVDGNDIRDNSLVISAGSNCQAVIHLAALLGNESETAEELTRTNLLGTWNVLESARINKLEKVIFMSSVDALGLFKGEGVPRYFPIDDSHPCEPTTPYAISKKLAEEMCESFTQNTGIPTICFRPPGVWSAGTYLQIIEAREARPEFEWDPFWEYGAFIDVRDLSRLVLLSIDTVVKGHHCYLVTSNDITTSGMTSKELAERIHPEVIWKNQTEYEKNPYRSLIECKSVKEAFGWEPQYLWQNFLEEN